LILFTNFNLKKDFFFKFKNILKLIKKILLLFLIYILKFNLFLPVQTLELAQNPVLQVA